MTLEAPAGSVPARPARGGRPVVATRPLAAALVGLSAFTLAYLFVPTRAYHALCIVQVSDANSPLALVLPTAAAPAARSANVLRKAADALVASHFATSEPNFIDRALLSLGWQGAKALGRVARLAEDLSQSVAVQAGPSPGTVLIDARNGDGSAAAAIANAVAEAFVADHDEALMRERDTRLAARLARLDRLRAALDEAHRQLAALGAGEAQAAEARAAEAALATAQARVAAYQEILRSGTPPLSDRRDVPAPIATLQANYLDLSNRLAEARQTLGDRHATIIALQAQVRQAAANLTAEWRHYARLAESALETARVRAAALKPAAQTLDLKKAAAIEEARRRAQIAQLEYDRAQAAGPNEVEAQNYAILDRANVPAAPDGLPEPIRFIVALAAALAAGALTSILTKRVQPRPAPRMPATNSAFVEAAGAPTRAAADSLAVALKRGRIMRDLQDPPAETAPRLVQSFKSLLSGLPATRPAFGPVPTILVATNEARCETMPIALALGRAAECLGHRTLVVELRQRGASLAAACALESDPAVIDFYGTLRVALCAARSDRALFLAPDLDDRADLASALVKQAQTPFVDSLEDEFDLIVIDGGLARDSASDGWGADHYLRVGLSRARREDATFTAAFAADTDRLLGTVVSNAFVASHADADADDSILSESLGVASGRTAPAKSSSLTRRPLPRASASQRRRAGVR
jgi:uncharacterized protein involved in exopolysaccharide biosynthesis